MPPPAPVLVDDLIENILRRLPPEDPGCLFRASLVCKRWRGLLTDRAFACRYRKFHRAPPLLGCFENQFLGCWFAAPSSPASPVPPIHPGHPRLDALDSRHGLVLLEVNDPRGDPLDLLAVWDPLRRRQWEFPFPEIALPLGFHDGTYSASVLCAADGCDHLDCRARGSPFLVVFLCSDAEGAFYASLYSSEAHAWSPVTSCEHSAAINLNTKPKVLAGNALYFTCHCEPTVMIVRYDLASRKLSVISGPAGSQANRHQYVLVGMDNGVLGFANVQGPTLCLWSIEASADGRTVAWGQHRVVELEKLLPPRAFSAEIYVTGFAEGVGVIVLTNAGAFTIELKSCRVKNVHGRTLNTFPYSSFYIPDQAGGVIMHLPTASSENSEADLDLLLRQPSMDVSKEREQGEEEGKWKDSDEEEGKWREDDDDEESEEEFEDELKQAHDMFDMWSNNIVDGDFVIAKICASALSSAERDDVGDMMPLPPNHDFNLAWKMLHIAKTILEKCPESSIEKVKIFSALADVKILSAVGRGSMQEEDKDYSLGVCFKALAFSEHLMEPDNYWIIKLIGDAATYCAKAISLCKSRVSILEVAKEALLLDKGDNASAAEAGSERPALDYEIEFLTGMKCKLEKKLEHLEQAKPTPTTEASAGQNVGDAMPRAASFTPASSPLELLSIFDPVLRKTSCTPIWSKLQDG